MAEVESHKRCNTLTRDGAADPSIERNRPLRPGSPLTSVTISSIAQSQQETSFKVFFSTNRRWKMFDQALLDQLSKLSYLEPDGLVSPSSSDSTSY